MIYMKKKEITVKFKLNPSGKNQSITLQPGEKITVTPLDKTTPVSFHFSVDTGANHRIYKLSATGSPILESAIFTRPHLFLKSDRFFHNGYQTWSISRETPIHEKIRRASPILYPFQVHCIGDSPFYKDSKAKHYSHSFSYITTKDNYFFFAGTLSDKDGYTTCLCNPKRSELALTKDFSGTIISPKDKNTRGNEPYDIFAIFASEDTKDKVFAEWIKQREAYQLKTEGQAPSLPPISTGWTSWYKYYVDVTEKDILENLQQFKERNIPIDYFQIDDGYHNSVGDWLLTNNKFPSGMAALADKIHQAGVKAGIWIAPFICSIHSKIYKENNDWIARDQSGKKIIAGRIPLWNGLVYALDIYNIEVRQYLKKVFKTIQDEWKYDLIKLDFLYAAALAHPKDVSPGRAMFDAMNFLKSLLQPGNQYLGCGVPMESAIGVTGFCRVSADISLKWEDKILKSLNYPERVSTFSALTSSIARLPLNGKAFRNDTDVFNLRGGDNKLTPTERYTLFILNNILGGLLFTSDNPGELPREILTLYKKMFPVCEKENIKVDREKWENVFRISFNIGAFKYITLTNLSNRKRYIKLNPGIYFKGPTLLSQPGFIEIPEDRSPSTQKSGLFIAPHKTVLLLRSGQGSPLAGDYGHLFPGGGIKSLKEFSKNSYKIEYKKNVLEKGDIILMNVDDKTTLNGEKGSLTLIGTEMSTLHQRVLTFTQT